MKDFSFIAPWGNEPSPLSSLIADAWISSTEHQRKLLVKAGVQIDGVEINNPKYRVDAGSHVMFSARGGTRDMGYPDWPELRRYQNCVFVEKPIGMDGVIEEDDPMNAVLFAADMLGFDRNTVAPAWPTDERTGGPWPLARSSEDATDLVGGDLSIAWVALVAIPIAGSFDHNGRAYDISVIGKRDGITEVQVVPTLQDDGPVDIVTEILSFFADHGSTVVGDVHRGGLLADYTRLRVQAFWDAAMEGENWPTPKDWWPGQIVPPMSEEPKTKSEFPTFKISKASLYHVRQGHPWILKDRDSDKGTFRSGTLVRLQAKGGDLGPLALATNEEPIVARVWGEGSFEEEIDIRIDEALALRGDNFGDISDTDIFRMINGEADGFPGLFVDRLGAVIRVTVRSQCTAEYRDHLYDGLIEREPHLTIVETVHDSDIRNQNALPTTRIISHGSSHIRPGDKVLGREHGLKYWLELWEGIDPGFFADQRGNRGKLLGNREDQRWLNLFCHTGAFSVVLASSGAQTVNVDLSPRYLEWFVDNLELNSIPNEDHVCHATDVRTFLESDTGSYDGIIVDPPTASSGEKFWSVKKDYETVLRQCFERLKPNGLMLACLNERGTKIDFETMLRSAAKSAGRKISLESAGPASDYPCKDGFPEGQTFVGFWVT